MTEHAAMAVPRRAPRQAAYIESRGADIALSVSELWNVEERAAKGGVHGQPRDGAKSIWLAQPAFVGLVANHLGVPATKNRKSNIRAAANRSTQNGSSKSNGGEKVLTGVVKVTVNLPASLVDALRTLAERDGETFTQVLKEAISTQMYVEEVQAQGATLLVERPDGTVREVVFR